MRHNLRPHQVFNLYETPQEAARMVNFVLPNQRTPKLLETAVLVALIKALEVRNVFEIGTLFGLQTLNLAANLPEDGHIWTLDLDEEAFGRARQNSLDREISRRHLEHQDRLAFAGSAWQDRVTVLLGDSTEFDFSPYLGRMNLVYVDGGHDRQTVASDSAHAWRLLADDRPGVVVWHDDPNPDYPDVSAVLNELAEERDLFHVEETMLTLGFNAKAECYPERFGN